MAGWTWGGAEPGFEGPGGGGVFVVLGLGSGSRVWGEFGVSFFAMISWVVGFWGLFGGDFV